MFKTTPKTSKTVWKYPLPRLWPIKTYTVNVPAFEQFAFRNKLFLPHWPAALELGHNSYASDAVDIRCFRKPGRVTVGRYSSIGECMFVVDGHHNHSFASTFPMREFRVASAAPWNDARKKSPSVGNDVWIGDRAVIYNVHLGDGCVVAGDSVVTKDVPPYAVVAGNPARVVGYRFDGERDSEGLRERMIKVRWWDLPDADVAVLGGKFLEDPWKFVQGAEAIRSRA